MGWVLWARPITIENTKQQKVKIKKVDKDFPATLFRKPKKLVRFTKLLGDDLLKEKVNLNIKYKDYKEFKRTVNEMIKEGFSISLELDETYTTDFDNLYLFSNILVSKDAPYYDTIINNTDAIKTNVVTVWGEIWTHS